MDIWDKFLGATAPSIVGVTRPLITGTILDDPIERARLMKLPPDEQTLMLKQALDAAPEYREQLAQASAAWGTWKQMWVVKSVRQALGQQTTKEEMQALIEAFRRLP
jgi:hypothetical protein